VVGEDSIEAQPAAADAVLGIGNAGDGEDGDGLGDAVSW